MIGIELPLTGRKRLLKTTPSPSGSGELETSPILTHFVRCGARPRCTLGRFTPSGRLTGGCGAMGLADPSPKFAFTELPISPSRYVKYHAC